MQPDELDVAEFEWDDSNEAHCARHEVTPLLAETLKDDEPRLFPNREKRSGTHMMIAADGNGRPWTLIVRPTGVTGRWRVITGWPSTRKEAMLYKRAAD